MFMCAINKYVATFLHYAASYSISSVPVSKMYGLEVRTYLSELSLHSFHYQILRCFFIMRTDKNQFGIPIHFRESMKASNDWGK